MNDKLTFDTNILIYAFGKQSDKRKQIAKDTLAHCSIISLQVVNETSYVLLKKFNFSIKELDKIIGFLRNSFLISDLTPTITDKTLHIVNRYGFSFWDSMILASSIDNGCSVLYSEDLQHDQIIDGQLKVINPFI